MSIISYFLSLYISKLTGYIWLYYFPLHRCLCISEQQDGNTHSNMLSCAPSNSFKPLNLLTCIECWILLTAFNSYPKDWSVLRYQKICDVNTKLPFFVLSQYKGCLDSHHKWRIHKISTRGKLYILLRFAIFAHRLWTFWRKAYLQIYLPPYLLRHEFLKTDNPPNTR